MIKEIIKRLKAETPSFFRKLRRFFLTLTAFAGVLETLPKQHTGWLPANTIAMLVTVGAVGAFLTSLVTKDPLNETT